MYNTLVLGRSVVVKLVGHSDTQVWMTRRKIYSHKVKLKEENKYYADAVILTFIQTFFIIKDKNGQVFSMKTNKKILKNEL